MRIWLWKSLKYSNAILGSLLIVLVFGTIAVAARFSIEYVVNSHRPTTHWVEYFDVRPTKEVFPVGVFPVFYSQSTWYRNITVSWNDIMWCEPESGQYAGKLRRLMSYTTGKQEYHRAGTVGILDAGEGYKPEQEPTSGFWQWNGPIPLHPSLCWLDPRVALYPSLGVIRDVRIRPTMTFYFR